MLHHFHTVFIDSSLCGHLVLINELMNDLSLIMKDKENKRIGRCVFSAEYKEDALLSCSTVGCPKQKPLAVILHFKIPQFVSNPFSGESVLVSEDVPTPKQSLSLAHFLILSKDWTLYDEMRKGRPDPSCRDRIENIELTLHPYHVGNTPTRLSLCECRIPASRRS